MSNELELLKALSSGVRDEISHKLNIKECDLNSAIDNIINLLENLKHNLPCSTKKMLWEDFSKSVSELYFIKGEIDAYCYTKRLSSIMEGKESE